MKSRKRRFRQNTFEDDSEKENDELRLCLTIAPDKDKEVNYEILDKKYPIIEWITEYLGTKPQSKTKQFFKDNQILVIADSLLTTLWFNNGTMIWQRALASPKANVISLAIEDQARSGGLRDLCQQVGALGQHLVQQRVNLT
ncbi:hypothetical protein Tco_1329466 [Tanacetum coccineum]